MRKQSNQSSSNLTQEQKGEALRTSLAAHLGILFGSLATLLGGTVGALSGKMTKTFSVTKGFTFGAVIAGGVTSAIQLVNWSRIGRAAADLPTEAIESDEERLLSGDLKIPEQRLTKIKNHVESLAEKRTEQTGLAR